MPGTNRPRSKKRLVDSNTNNNLQPRSDIESSVDQTVVGLYDYPPKDARSREYVSGRHPLRSTERKLQYQAIRSSQEGTCRKSNDTRARKWSLSRHSNEASNHAGTDPSDTEAVSTGQRGRPRTSHPLAPSTGTEATVNENNPPTQATDNTQYTFEYETLTHEGLVQYAKDKFNLDVEDRDTCAILELLELAEAEQAPEMGSSRGLPSIVMLPPTPFGVGGGWSQQVVGTKRRGSQVSIPSNDDGAGKPRRKVMVEEVEDVDAPKRHGKVVPDGRIMVEEDTATEEETDDEPIQPTDSSARLAAEQIMAGCTDNSTSFNGRPCPPQRGTQVPHPTRNDTPVTVLDSQLSNASHSLGASPSQRSLDSGSQDDCISPELLKKLSEWSSRPLRGPTHAHLRSELILRFIADALRKSGAANAQPTDADEASQSLDTPEFDSSQCATRGSPLHPSHSSSSSRPDTTIAEPAGTSSSTDVDEVPETTFNSASDILQRARHGTSASARTYSRSRSYRTHPSGPQATLSGPVDTANAAEVVPPPKSRSLNAAQLLRRERTGTAKGSSRIIVAAKKPPTSRAQARPPLGGPGNAVGKARGGARRLDPASAARSDMLAFNRAAARNEATSHVESVSQQNTHAARHSPPPSHTSEDLLEDEDEPITQARAYAKRRWPPRRSRVRKPKPLARDVSGLDRQILIMAKIHLFAYALIHGIYQSRSTFLGWSSDVHEATAQVELPDRPYDRPGQEIYEIMVNSIAARRGKAKEQLREFVARVSGFRQNMKKHEIIQRNKELFDQLYPNNFHCRSYNPRQDDYEHPEIGHCIALIIFNGPNSWQFCLEEWTTGWRENGDLSVGDMREKYEALLAGLHELRRVAPRRMSRLQNQWRDYIVEYSGALLGPGDDNTANPTHPPPMRPDTPELDEAISVEEMNERLLETARQASIRECMAQLAAEELANPTNFDEDLGSHTSAPPSRAQTPPTPEYNSHGVITARSKGKGHAN